MAIAPPLQATPSADWQKVALDSAFPFDGAKYEVGGVHDPSIALFGDTYVMVTTSGNELAPISTSKDLLKWETHGAILNPRPDWLVEAIPQHNSVWAPAPLKVGDALRVYYCASARFGQNTSYIGYAECKDFDPAKPTDGWVDKGKLVESTARESNFNAIDPDVFIGPDGRHWMVYGSYWSGMYQIELDPTTGALKKGAEPQHVASNDEDGNPLEAPVMFYRDGYYYLAVTYGLAAQGIRSTYRMVCGRSKSPTGPFLGYDDKPMTEGGHTFLLRGSSPMFAPGGGNFFKNADGDLMMAYHYYDGREHWNRDLWGAPTLQMRKLLWGKDGWPLPGLPVGTNLPKSTAFTGEWTFQVDFGRIQTLELLPEGKTRMGRQEGNWEESDGQLLLKWTDADAPSGAWVDTLVIDESRQYIVGRNQRGTVVRGIKKNVAQVR